MKVLKFPDKCVFLIFCGSFKVKRVPSPWANGPELDPECRRIYRTQPFPELGDFSIEPENQEKEKHYFWSTNTRDDDGENELWQLSERPIKRKTNTVGHDNLKLYFFEGIMIEWPSDVQGVCSPLSEIDSDPVTTKVCDHWSLDQHKIIIMANPNQYTY